MTFDHTYGMRAKQAAAGLQVTIDGMTDWKLPLQRKIAIDPKNAHMYGNGVTEATLETVYAKNADSNGTTNESRWLAGLINEGYEPLELEVSFTNPKEALWGRCQWLEEHPSYSDPENWLRKLRPEAAIPDGVISIIDAMFSTENAGEQTHGLLSTSIVGSIFVGIPIERIGFVFHKTIIFHRVRFAPLKQVAA
jgi:hypothetical protein